MENDNVLIVHNNAKSDVAWFLFSETLTVLRTRLIPLGSNCRRFPWKKKSAHVRNDENLVL